MLRTETLEIGRPKNKHKLKKLTSKRIQALQTAQKTTPQEKTWVEDGSGKEREKVVLRTEKGEKSVILSSKRNTTTKNSWVDKDLTKSRKNKCFEGNGSE